MSLTDWARVDALTDAEIEAAAREDPDTILLDDAMLADAEMIYPGPKERITLRLDRDVLAALRREGPGYQTRIGHILRAYVQMKGRQSAK